METTQALIEKPERDLRLKLIDFSSRPQIQDQIGEAFYIWTNDPELLVEDFEKDDIDDLTFTKFNDWFLFDFKLIDKNMSVFELFYERERESLSELEKSILDDWRNNIYSFFDVEEVIPDLGCRIKDLFTGQELFVNDASGSRQLSLKDIIGARPLKTGNMNFFSGTISIYPRAFRPIILDLFKREFNEYKIAFGRKSSVRDYLKNWGFLIGHHIERMIYNRSYETPEGEKIVLSSASYSFEDYESVISNLKQIKSIMELSGGSDELRVFHVTELGDIQTSAAIEIENNTLRIECHTLSSLNVVKGLIETRLRGLIKFSQDTFKQLEQYNQQGLFSTKKLPTGRNKSDLDTILDDYYNKWIEIRLQTLDGKTPREASETEEGRKRLKLIINELESLYNHARMRGEPYYKVEKLREKLNL